MQILTAAQGELPVVAALPLNAVSGEVLAALAATGITAITLTAPRGLLPDPDGKLVSGRLYGPAFFPLAMAALAQTRRLGLPIIAGAGVWNLPSAQALLSFGASAVQLDGLLWHPAA